MDMEYKEIPETISVGGVLHEIVQVERCVDNNLGLCCVAEGRIEIAHYWGKDRVQCMDSKRQTFYHELTHAILDTMGEGELSKNEKFVNTFSSFLNEALRNARYICFGENNGG